MIKIAGSLVTAEDISEKDADYLKSVIEASANDDGTLTIKSFHQSITLDPRLLQFSPDLAVGYAGLEKTIQLVWDSERFGTRDTASSVADRKGIDGINDPLFIAGFSNGNIFLITRKKLLVNGEGMEVQDIAVDGLEYTRPRLWIASQDEALQKVVVKYKAKRELLAKLNTSDAIAALEKQLDLVTSLLLIVAADNPSNPAWAGTLKEIVDTASANKFVSAEEALAQIKEQKEHIRVLQEKYFKARSETV